jgi:hypothetical protein
LENEFSEEVK